MRLRSRILVVAVGTCVLMVAASPAAVFGDDRLWTESQGASAPPEMVRLNDFLHHLAERLKPP